MSVCKLDNNGIYNLPTSISETGDVSMPTNLDEQSIGEPVPGHDHDFTVNQEAAGITFQLVEQGTKRGKARIIDNLGYTSTCTTGGLMQPIGSAQSAPKEILAEPPLPKGMGPFSQGRTVTTTQQRPEPLRPSPSKTWSVTSTISGSRAGCSRPKIGVFTTSPCVQTTTSRAGTMP